MDQPKTLSLRNRVAKASQISPWVKALIWGPPGGGKSVFCATAPNPLFLQIEPRGADSLKNHTETKDTPVLTLEKYDDINTLVQETKNGGFDDVDTFIVDTIDFLQRLQIMDINARTGKFIAEGKDYQLNTEIMRKLLVDLLFLPNKHIIFVSHEQLKEDQNGIFRLQPNITPKLLDSFVTLLSLFGYMYADDPDSKGAVKRYLQVHPTKKIMAKTRIGGLPLIMEQPHFSHIIKAANENEPLPF